MYTKICIHRRTYIYQQFTNLKHSLKVIAISESPNICRGNLAEISKGKHPVNPAQASIKQNPYYLDKTDSASTINYEV